MKLLLCLIVYIYCLLHIDGTPGVLENYEEDYYWRRYSGIIPSDAVPGGLDEYDNITYIGQTFSDGSTVPGVIYDNTKTMAYEYFEHRLTKENIKVLCSRYPESFEWIKVTDSNYKFLWSKHIVQGGHFNDTNTPFLIARISHQNKELLVVKVRIEGANLEIVYTIDKVRYYVNNNMELLSFNERLKYKTLLKNSFVSSSKSLTVNDESLLEPNSTERDRDSGCLTKQFNFYFS